MDFTKVQELELGNTQQTFFNQMKHELPGLRKLTMTVSDFQTYTMDFLDSIPPLEALSIRPYPPYIFTLARNRTEFPLLGILSRHGSSLRSLELHQDESEDFQLRRPMFSTEQIAEIDHSCPHLKHLGLDIDRNGTWPNATLDALVMNSRLTSLSLSLEIGSDLHQGERGEYNFNPQGLSGPGPFREPRMSLNKSEELFSYLRKKKQGEELKRLNITVGRYSELPYRGPLHIPNWEDRRTRLFICDTESGDGKRERVGNMCTVRGT